MIFKGTTKYSHRSGLHWARSWMQTREVVAGGLIVQEQGQVNLLQFIQWAQWEIQVIVRETDGIMVFWFWFCFLKGKIKTCLCCGKSWAKWWVTEKNEGGVKKEIREMRRQKYSGTSGKTKRGEQVGSFLNCDGVKGKGCSIVKENIVM